MLTFMVATGILPFSLIELKFPVVSRSSEIEVLMNNWNLSNYLSINLILILASVLTGGQAEVELIHHC